MTNKNDHYKRIQSLEDTSVALVEETDVPLASLGLAPNVRSVSGLSPDEIEALADDIYLNGLLQPLHAYPVEDEGYLVWDGQRRLTALRRLAERGAIDEMYGVAIVVTDVPPDLTAAQLRANRYRELRGGEVMAALLPYFAGARRKNWRQALKEGKTAYQRGSLKVIQERFGIAQPDVSRYGRIALWEDLTTLWGLDPEIPATVMYDVSGIESAVERCKRLISASHGSDAELLSAFKTAYKTAKAELAKGGNGSATSAGSATARPGAKALRDALVVAGRNLADDSIDYSEHAFAVGVYLALRWALGSGPSPVGISLDGDEVREAVEANRGGASGSQDGEQGEDVEGDTGRQGGEQGEG